MTKTFLSLLMFFSGICAFAAAQYGGGAFQISSGGISIKENLSSFSFSTNFGNVGGSASLGYYTYTDNIADYQLGEKTFSKKDGKVELGALSEGQNVGFFLKRNNGEIISDFYFTEKNGTYSLHFDKNSGHGKDESFMLGNIIVVSASGNVPAGQPLPGVLAALLIGAAGVGTAGFFGKRKHR